MKKWILVTPVLIKIEFVRSSTVIGIEFRISLCDSICKFLTTNCQLDWCDGLTRFALRPILLVKIIQHLSHKFSNFFTLSRCKICKVYLVVVCTKSCLVISIPVDFWLQFHKFIFMSNEPSVVCDVVFCVFRRNHNFTKSFVLLQFSKFFLICCVCFIKCFLSLINFSLSDTRFSFCFSESFFFCFYVSFCISETLFKCRNVLFSAFFIESWFCFINFNLPRCIEVFCASQFVLSCFIYRLCIFQFISRNRHCLLCSGQCCFIKSLFCLFHFFFS